MERHYGISWKMLSGTFFRTKDGGVSVVCGCFHGTLQEFIDKVKETHGESKMAKDQPGGAGRNAADAAGNLLSIYI